VWETSPLYLFPSKGETPATDGDRGFLEEIVKSLNNFLEIPYQIVPNLVTTRPGPLGVILKYFVLPPTIILN
jgi:hypothetical protein